MAPKNAAASVPVPAGKSVKGRGRPPKATGGKEGGKRKTKRKEYTRFTQILMNLFTFRSRDFHFNTHMFYIAKRKYFKIILD